MKRTTNSTSTVFLQDGKYDGAMSGCTVQVKVKHSDISLIDIDLQFDKRHVVITEFEIEDGVRGFNVPCSVEVENHKAVVTIG